jgi:predicted GIY-YIG superfamily endonuclease
MPVAMRAAAGRGRPYRGSGTVYVLHFAEPYHHARHYVGYTDNLPARLADHSAGAGARLLAAVGAAGIGFDLAWTWPNASRAFERKIHRYKRTPTLCPLLTLNPRRSPLPHNRHQHHNRQPSSRRQRQSSRHQPVLRWSPHRRHQSSVTCCRAT